MIVSSPSTAAASPAQASCLRAGFLGANGLRRAGRLVALLIGTLLFAPLHRAPAQDIGDVAAGRKLAQTWCSSCHLIGPDAVSGTSNGAPPLAAVARMKSTTVLSLRAFLQTPHARMPDLHLTRDEVDDLAGYILSLRPQPESSR
jgi:mono/diheme cytochrome c family protein